MTEDSKLSLNNIENSEKKRRRRNERNDDKNEDSLTKSNGVYKNISMIEFSHMDG